jgi:hypothetical protein
VITTLLPVKTNRPTPPFKPMTPDALRLEQALQQSAPLVKLKERIQDSNARFAAILPGLPTGLALHLKPGSVDELGWTLLAANTSVAAKLRQIKPELESMLSAAGWRMGVIRIKVLQN